ncbi:MAG TPA: hypothetical protein VD997_02560 [Phycisphaerales bacterium]|nr:hypothetical protein [Phycisphaerales bacterium]
MAAPHLSTDGLSWTALAIAVLLLAVIVLVAAVVYVIRHKPRDGPTWAPSILGIALVGFGPAVLDATSGEAPGNVAYVLAFAGLLALTFTITLDYQHRSKSQLARFRNAVQEVHTNVVVYRMPRQQALRKSLLNLSEDELADALLFLSSLGMR